MWLEYSLRLLAPVHKRKRDGYGEEQTREHDEDLLRFILVVLLNLLAFDVSVPANVIRNKTTDGIVPPPRTQQARGAKQVSFVKFLPRDALYCKARYCDRMSFVRLSVHVSVCYVSGS